MIFYKPLHPLSIVRFDPISDALLIAAIASAGAGIGILASGMQDSPDTPTPPALPDPAKAKTDAIATNNSQRRALLASGGQTDYTNGTGTLTGSDTSKAILLGG